MKRLTFISRPGCHLCDDARLVVQAAQGRYQFDFNEVNVDEHPELLAKYRDHLPVVLLDDVLIAYWFLPAAQLELALRDGPGAVSVQPL